MDVYPAVTLKGVWRACDPNEALKPGDERFVDLSAVRSEEPSLTKLISTSVENCGDDKFLYKLVTGHRGSGKTTELLRLRERLKEDGLFVVYADATETLDLGDVSFLDVLLVIAQALGEALEKEKIKIDGNLLEEIDLWFAEKVMTTTEDESGAVSASVGVEAGAGFLGIGKLFAKATTEIKSASSQRDEIRVKLDRHLSNFLELLKLFVQDARLKIKKKGYSNIALIFDGLEKVMYKANKEGVSNHFEMFIHHADQLRVPGCHLIYTVPISLAFKAQLADAWPDSYYPFPMIKQQTEQGKAALLAVVGKRVDVAKAFETPDTLEDFIALSGGAVRDLLRLIQSASLYAEDRIGKEDGRKAIASFLRQEERLIREKDKEKLRLVEQGKPAPNTEEYEALLANRLIHEYENGHCWADVHPAVKILLNLPGKPTLKTYSKPS